MKNATATRRKRRSPEERKAAMQNVLYTALGSWASKNSDRKMLAAGERHEIAITIAGYVDDQWIEEDLIGSLLVNHDQEIASSLAPDYQKLIALLLSKIPATRRLALVADVQQAFQDHGEIPAPDDATLEIVAEGFLKKLRQKKTTTRKGSVRFEPRAA